MSPCITDSFPFEGPCDRPCIALRTSVLPPWAPAPGPDGQARCVPVQEDSGSYSDTFKVQLYAIFLCCHLSSVVGGLV